MNNCINTYIFEAIPHYEIPADLFVRRSTPKDYGEYLVKKGKKRKKKK